MNRLWVFLLVVVLPFAAAGLSPYEQKSRRQRNRPPTISSFSSSTRALEICPFFSFYKPEVELLVVAIDPDGDSLTYEYSSTEGKISGSGQLVAWNLDRVPRGPHEIKVTVSDGKGGKASESLTVHTVDAGECHRPPPPCPVVTVTCPAEIDESKPFVFSAVVELGPELSQPSSFNWKLNAGKIVKGQNSREIEVTTTDATGFDKLTATVTAGGYDPSCPAVGICTTKIIR